MKRLLTIGVMLWVSLLMWAQPAYAPEWSSSCELVRKTMGYPHHYCACWEGSNTFAYPLEQMVRDTAWYTASLDDLKQGITAYWFSDCSVTIELFAFCSASLPTITYTIGPNQVCDVDKAEINKRLNEMNETVQAILSGALTPHMRIYPNGGKGRVYCYPYDQGPESTCENPLPMLPKLAYVCDKSANVYRLDTAAMGEDGAAFFRWRQKENKACEIWLTLDDCNGEEIGRAQLTDSVHVYQPDKDLLRAAKEANRAIWVHVQHEQGITGRLFYHSSITFLAEATEKQTSCEGMKLEINERTYTRDTVFEDTVWVTGNKLQPVQMDLYFEPRTIIYDTICVNATTLRHGYQYTANGVNAYFYEYGDTTLTIAQAGQCTRSIQLHITSPEGIESVMNGSRRAYKQLENGRLWIIIDDRKYDLLGKPISTNNIN